MDDAYDLSISHMREVGMEAWHALLSFLFLTLMYFFAAGGCPGEERVARPTTAQKL